MGVRNIDYPILGVGDKDLAGAAKDVDAPQIGSERRRGAEAFELFAGLVIAIDQA